MYGINTNNRNAHANRNKINLTTRSNPSILLPLIHFGPMAALTTRPNISNRLDSPSPHPTPRASGRESHPATRGARARAPSNQDIAEAPLKNSACCG